MVAEAEEGRPSGLREEGWYSRVSPPGAFHLIAAQQTELLMCANSSDDMLKEELVTELNQTLRQNETKFGSDPDFIEFYARSSPVKKEKGATTATSDAEKQPRKRRQTLKVKEELDSL